MPIYKAKLEIERDGTLLPGFPMVRRLEVDERQEGDVEEADDADSGVFNALPTSSLSTVQFLFLTSDQQVTIRLDGQSDAGIVLNAGGFLLISNATIDAGASTNATINNTTGSTANIKLISGGT